MNVNGRLQAAEGQAARIWSEQQWRAAFLAHFIPPGVRARAAAADATVPLGAGAIPALKAVLAVLTPEEHEELCRTWQAFREERDL